MKDKRDKFVELANKRTKKALHSIKLLSNLSNKRYYSYDKTQVNKILNALKDELRKLEQTFNDKNNSIDDFKL